MYITQFEINTKNHLVFKDLTSLSAYHGMIESAFPAEQLLGIRKRHLWRLDKGKILLVSEDKPDKNALAKYGKNIQAKNYDTFLNSLNTNTIYAFEIVANPTKQGPNKKRISIYDEQDQLNWLKKKSLANGFEIQSTRIAAKKNPIVNKRHFKFISAKFKGTLTITNPKKFKNAMINGIGHDKAYGMGLLTVIPLVRKK